MLPQGWFSPDDQVEYRYLVGSLPNGATMVEVGVWLGRSLCSVADLIRQKRIRVIAVDTFTKKRATGHAPLALGQYETFLNNLWEYGVTPTCYQMDSLHAAKMLRPVDFVFLDADHTYASVTQEIAAWRPKASRLMGGHDYDNHEIPAIAVKRAVDEAFPHVRVRGRVWSVPTL